MRRPRYAAWWGRRAWLVLALAAFTSAAIVAAFLADRDARARSETQSAGQARPPRTAPVALLEVGSFPVHTGSRISLADGGRRVAATAGEGEVRVWDVRTGQRLAGVPGFDDEIALSGDGRFLACASSHPQPAVSVLEVPSLRKAAHVKVPLPPLSLALSPGGERLAVADRGDRITLFDIGHSRPARALVWGARLPMALAFSADGRTLAALSNDDLVWTWNTSTWRKARAADNVARLEDEHAGRLVTAVSGDGRRVASGDSSGSIQVWDAATLQEVAGVQHGDRHIQAIVLSGDGQWLAGVSRTGTLRVWGLDTGPSPRAIGHGFEP